MKINWIIGETSYICKIEPGHCPFCYANEAVCELPPPIRDMQPDGTTHACLPQLGGCDQGFAKDSDTA